MNRLQLVIPLLLVIAAGCTRPGDPLKRTGDEIVVAGQLFHTGTPVVLWLDPGGYDAYRPYDFYERDRTTRPARSSGRTTLGYEERYGLPDSLTRRVREQGWTLANLQEQVSQFVIHYDVCGTSKQCFKVLHTRGLSVPFMLDIDGTVYQTLDLKERAWHAGEANSRSVGVEIAHIGAYPDMKRLDEWYARDENGWPYITLPASLLPSGVRTPNFVGRPARKEPVRGRIQGQDLIQYDFTNEQYEALIRLTAALARALPRIRIDAPRDAQGNIRTDVLSPEELKAFEGLLGHYHVTRVKIDPGPAFDWDRVLKGARRHHSSLF